MRETDLDELSMRMRAVLARSDADPAQAVEDKETLATLREEVGAARALSAKFAEPDDASNPDHPRRLGKPPPDWDRLAAQAERILAGSRKRADVAAWLLEALTRAHGLAGFAASCALTATLIEDHWDQPSPQPPAATEDDDSDPGPAKTPFEPLRRVLDDQLATILVGIKLCETGAGAVYTLDTIERRQGASIGKRTPDEPEIRPWDEVAEQVRNDPTPEALALHRAARAAEAAWRRLLAGARAKQGRDLAPRSFQAAFARLQAAIASMAPPETPVAAPSVSDRDLVPAEPVSSDPSFVSASVPTPVPASDAMTRDRALAVLTEIAGFFRSTEPQSPVASILEEAVRRARLNWAELIEEMLPELQERERVLERLGLRAVRAPEAPSESEAGA